MTIKLKAIAREIIGKKVKNLRKQEIVPAVLYGNKIASRNIAVPLLEIERAYANAGESAILELELDGKKLNVLIHDVQNDHLSGKISHVDFFQVNMKEEVETEIPLEFVGESEAVKALGGVLVKNMDEVPVKCLPTDLPPHFEIDLSKIKTFDDHITVADIKVSDKVKIELELDAVIALVTPPRTQEELESLEQKVEEDVTKIAGVVKEGENGVEKK